jgi:hypothetical protein
MQIFKIKNFHFCNQLIISELKTNFWIKKINLEFKYHIQIKNLKFK